METVDYVIRAVSGGGGACGLTTGHDGNGCGVPHSAAGDFGMTITVDGRRRIQRVACILE